MLVFDKIFVTSKLEALIYCLNNNIPTILYGGDKELKHKFLLEYSGLPLFLNFKKNEIIVDNAKAETFNSAEDVQNQILIHMGLKGLIPFPERIQNIYILDDLLSLTFDKIGSFDVSYEKLIVTDEVKLSGVDLKSTKISDSLIIDYFKSEKLRSLKNDILFPDDDILKQIYFWKEQNIVITISEIKNIHDFNASWVPLKYKIRKSILDSSGQKLRVWPLKRIVEEKVKHIYEEVPHVKTFNEEQCLKLLGT
jgi:hypothetical protein